MQSFVPSAAGQVGGRIFGTQSWSKAGFTPAHLFVFLEYCAMWFSSPRLHYGSDWTRERLTFYWNMKKRIVGFHLDEEQHWVAELECGHNQHVRHNPPWTIRPWVITEEGRDRALGHELNCKKCDAGAPPDQSDLH
jgi:hypothetical protein